MNKFLLTTTALAGLTMSGAAFAQAVPAEPVAQAPASLLQSLLDNAEVLSASLSNVAENLNEVNGSIDISTTRSLTEMDALVKSLGGSTGFGSYSQVGSGVYGRDIPASLLAVLDPTVATLGDLSTTAIGAMQSGSIIATIDASGIQDRVSSAATGSSTSADAMAESYGGIGGTIAVQNIANNLGGIDGSVTLALADVNATVGKVATTAIGAMGSGDLTATVKGNMAGTSSNTAAIIAALVGTPAP
jgi:hypothetical protein